MSNSLEAAIPRLRYESNGVCFYPPVPHSRHESSLNTPGKESNGRTVQRDMTQNRMTSTLRAAQEQAEQAAQQAEKAAQKLLRVQLRLAEVKARKDNKTEMMKHLPMGHLHGTRPPHIPIGPVPNVVHDTSSSSTTTSQAQKTAAPQRALVMSGSSISQGYMPGLCSEDTRRTPEKEESTAKSPSSATHQADSIMEKRPLTSKDDVPSAADDMPTSVQQAVINSTVAPTSTSPTLSEVSEKPGKKKRQRKSRPASWWQRQTARAQQNQGTTSPTIPQDGRLSTDFPANTWSSTASSTAGAPNDPSGSKPEPAVISHSSDISNEQATQWLRSNIGTNAPVASAPPLGADHAPKTRVSETTTAEQEAQNREADLKEVPNKNPSAVVLQIHRRLQNSEARIYRLENMVSSLRKEFREEASKAEESLATSRATIGSLNQSLQASTRRAIQAERRVNSRGIVMATNAVADDIHLRREFPALFETEGMR